MTAESIRKHCIVTPNHCWEWQRARDRGYGVGWHNGKKVLVHRLMFEITNRALLAGECVCHRCDNPPCVNPEHLFAGSPLDNTRDAIAKGRIVPTKSLPKNRGELSASAKLTVNDVLEIRKLRDSGSELLVIASQFGISRTQVHNIATRKKWAHV